MNYRDAEKLEIYERKYSLEYIDHLFVDKRIWFPVGVARPRTTMERALGQLLDAIWMGIPLPPIYVSEQQNGDLLVLEENDNLWKLLWFLEGRYAVDFWLENEHITDCTMKMLQSDEPKLARKLYDTVVSFQIIDYRTPKYLHMSVGKFVAHWSITREQAIREIMYDSYGIDLLYELSNDMQIALGRERVHSRTSDLVNRYRILYMIMNWFVYTGLWRDDIEMQEQCVLEETIESIDWQKRRVDDLLNVTRYFSEYISCFLNESSRRVSRNLKKIIQDKYLGLFVCFMDMAQMHHASNEYVDQLLFERGLFYDICMDLERHQLTKHSIEFAIEKWEREL